MSAALANDPSAQAASRNQNLCWLIALGGFASMYAPVYWWAANSIWQSDEHGHGPIILAVIVWLFWSLRVRIAAERRESAGLGGWLVFLVGLLVYVVGRAFRISILELGSQMFVVAGVILLLRGWGGLRVAWFPVLYFVFMVPLPGMLVDAVTGPLKQGVSSIVESILYTAGYPIARTGVVISIGQYQLLVADACSGLNSMFSLSALGTLFMYIMGRRSKLHNAAMLTSILPIAFAANVIRVITLVLITYHFGDEAGQGFLHGSAGIVLMIVALVIFFTFDFVLARLLAAPPASLPKHPRSEPT
jgi:exosortase B